MSSAKALPVGSLVEVEAEGRVQVTRPDGSTTEVAASEDGVARLVLAMAGTYSIEAADGTRSEVKAK